MKGWKKYVKNDILTSHPIKVTVMAIERCIFNLKFVKERYEKMRYIEAEDRLINTEQILHELTMQLNPQGDEEIIKNLYNLYDWCLREINELKLKKEPSKVEGIIAVLQDLLDGYKGVINKSE